MVGFDTTVSHMKKNVMILLYSIKDIMTVIMTLDYRRFFSMNLRVYRFTFLKKRSERGLFITDIMPRYLDNQNGSIQILNKQLCNRFIAHFYILG